jgi:hypothetical protein
VRNGETGDVDIADGEAGAGLEKFEVRRVLIPLVTPRNCRCGEARNIDRDAKLASDDLQAFYMVGVFVGDENRGERFGMVAGGMEPLEGLFAGEAGVDQETGSLGRNQRGIAGA